MYNLFLDVQDLYSSMYTLLTGVQTLCSSLYALLYQYSVVYMPCVPPCTLYSLVLHYPVFHVAGWCFACPNLPIRLAKNFSLPAPTVVESFLLSHPIQVFTTTKVKRLQTLTFYFTLTEALCFNKNNAKRNKLKRGKALRSVDFCFSRML